MDAADAALTSGVTKAGLTPIADNTAPAAPEGDPYDITTDRFGDAALGRSRPVNAGGLEADGGSAEETSVGDTYE